MQLVLIIAIIELSVVIIGVILAFPDQLQGIKGLFRHKEKDSVLPTSEPPRNNTTPNAGTTDARDPARDEETPPTEPSPETETPVATDVPSTSNER
ncbi:hypothetical protein B7463_g10862, partial [Scytalidium lignicola]